MEQTNIFISFINDILSSDGRDIFNLSGYQLQFGLKIFQNIFWSMSQEIFESAAREANLWTELRKMAEKLKEQTDLALRHAALSRFYHQGLEHAKTDKASYILHLGRERELHKELRRDYRSLERSQHQLEIEFAEKSRAFRLLEDKFSETKKQLAMITENSQKEIALLKQNLSSAENKLLDLQSDAKSKQILSLENVEKPSKPIFNQILATSGSVTDIPEEESPM
jgi:hypothetical protein